MGHVPEADTSTAPPSRIRRVLRKAWWLHSTFALSFGVGVMLFARAGLAHADKVLIALFASWLLMFIAMRFIVGPANRRDNEAFFRKGIRVATNYVIKQFYQQMFFFLTPLYASSATWSLQSWNWWLAPILLVCAVLSTMDLVFDNFVMERRLLASAMYGLAMFGVLNVMLPLVLGVDHLTGLIVAAAATPASVALLSFSVRQVLSPQGAILTLAMTGVMLGAVWYGRSFIPPAPLAMPETAVGHGSEGSYECLPSSKHQIRPQQLDRLRCGSLIREPGGLKEPLVHVWTLHRREVARITPDQLRCDGDGIVFRSYFPQDKMPKDPTGIWSCETFTVGGQLVGLRKFEVLTAEGRSIEDAPPPPPAPTDAGVTDGSRRD
ncbi:MAG: hypothetical protein JWO36_5754 [Myxococcales bacterium]|nr:hypothetical protein [Myxococcales bacterium]